MNKCDKLKADFVFFKNSKEDYNLLNNRKFMMEHKIDKFERLYME